jgi:hypothetical protein
MPQEPDEYIFQQNSAPPHFWTPVTEFFNKQITGIWIHQVAPPSPSLQTLGYFLQGYIKDALYQAKVNDLPDLHCTIVDAVASVILEMLRNT